jgi:hypothetical protein
MGREVVEVRSWQADATEGRVELFGQSVHFFGGGAVMRTEPEFTAGPSQDRWPVPDGECRRQMEVEHPKVGGDVCVAGSNQHPECFPGGPHHQFNVLGPNTRCAD